MSKLHILGAMLICAATLAACTGVPVDRQKRAPGPHYWQRTDASSALFMDGPKAQQMLERDMVACVTELRELEKLQAIVEVNDKGKPDSYPSGNSRVYDDGDVRGAADDRNLSARKELADKRKVKADFLPYYNFRSCMNYHGWELLESTPYELAKKDAEAYVDAILARRYRSVITQDAEPEPVPAKIPTIERD